MSMKTADLTSDPLLGGVPVCEGYKVLGGVVLYQKLGQGGMGAVYKGRHARLNVDVAVKVMAAPASLAPDQTEAFVKRFIREAQTAAAVSHQNLIRVYDVNAEAGLHFLIMDFVDGESAGERLKRKGRLSEEEAVEICLGAAEGLAEAHRKGIVHRDVKPDNIMIDREGRVRVTDLGLAKAFSGEEDSNRPTMLTQTQTAMGTPYYMSPEQFASARDVGPAADVWSMGVTLYQLLTGSLPWTASSVYLLASKVMNEPLPDPRTARPELSEGVAKLIERATRKSPQERFKDCSEMASALRAHLDTIRTSGGSSLADAAAGATRLALAAMTPPTVNTMSLVSRSLAQVAKTPMTRPVAAAAPGAVGTSATAPAGPPIRRMTGAIVAKTGLVPLIAGVTMAGAAIVGVVLFLVLGAYSRNRDEEEDAAAWRKARAEAEARAAAEDYAGALGAIHGFLSSAKTGRFRGEAEELRLRYDERLKGFAEETAWNRTQSEVESLGKAGNFGAAIAAVDGFLASVRTERLRRAAAALRKDLEEKKAALDARKAAEGKLAALLASAKTLREAALLDQAREKLVEALAISPDHAEAKRMLDEVQKEIDSRKTEAERAAEYRRWMDRGLELKLLGKLLEAAEAFGRAAQNAPRGSREAADSAASCLHDHYKAQAAEADSRGDFVRAVALYEKAFEQRPLQETMQALEAARKKLDAARAEEARRAEATRLASEAEAAEKAGDLRKAIVLYRQAAELGYDAAAKLRALEAELRYRELLERARSFAARGSWREAAQAVDAVLQLRPGDPEAKKLLAEAARHVGPRTGTAIQLAPGLALHLVYVRPGKFTMGFPDGPEEERPAREVEITNGFYLGKYEVTQAQYEQVMGANPSEPKGADLPVTGVSWAEAVEFCRRLSASAGRRFRLPTEAEWEYAARGREGRTYPWGNERPGADRANLPGAEDGFAGPAPCGSLQKGSTPDGIADMAGNVAEWCSDWYGPYDPSARRDPTGPAAGTSRVVRGGAYKLDPSFARASARGCRAPDRPLYLIGFRVLGELTDEERAFEKRTSGE